MSNTADLPTALCELEAMGQAHEQNQAVAELSDIHVAALGQHLSEFRRLASDLAEEQLRHIIKGFILFSRQHSPYGFMGSVSPCSALFKVYARRFPETEADLCTWILANRVNQYDPFGTVKHNSARSMREHRGQMGNSAAVARQNEEREAERQGLLRATRLDLEKERARKNLPGAIARGDQKAIEALKRKIHGTDSDD